MTNHQTTIIVGGGIIGLLCARKLSQAGISVTLVDQGEIGRESSWAGGGILSPLYPWRYSNPVNDLAFQSQKIYSALCHELKQSTGIDPQWSQTGLLILEPGDSKAALDWADRNGVVMELLSGKQVLTKEPGLGTIPSEAIWMPEIAQVRNPRLLAALRSDLERRGCDLSENIQVTDITVENGRFKAIRTSEGELVSELCLLASGAWTGALSSRFRSPLGIKPVKGQMILFNPPASKAPLLSTIILSDNRYLIPRRDGRILVGSTLEHEGFDKTLTAEAEHELTGFAVKQIPDLRKLAIEHHWAGLRPGTSEGIPYIGEEPTAKGLVVCSGHFRNGFVLGPASAELAVNLLLDINPTAMKATNMASYQLDRAD